MTWVSFFCVWPLPIPTYVSVLSYYLCYKRDGPPACNKTLWPHKQNRGIRTTFKQKWPSRNPRFPLTMHWIWSPRHLLLRPSTPLEILHERFPASVAHGTHPTHPRQLYHRTVAAPFFFSPSPRHFSWISKLWWFLYLGILGGCWVRIFFLCDLPSHIFLRHKSKPKFGFSIKPVLFLVALSIFHHP